MFATLFYLEFIVILSDDILPRNGPYLQVMVVRLRPEDDRRLCGYDRVYRQAHGSLTHTQGRVVIIDVI